MKTKFLIITLVIVAFVLISFAMPNLSKVYGSCEMTENDTIQPSIGYQYTNGLLYIDNAECTWKLFGVIPIASLLSEETGFQNFGIVQFTYADCNADVNYNTILKNSELVFVGTVTRLDNYDGPQRVTFFVHDVIKGDVNTPKHVLENTGKIFLEDGAVRSSSIAVDYKIGKTYKVYVENGDTTQCTTKLTAPLADYVWEPGPEDGNYYSENPVYQDLCEEGYGVSDGVCITLEEMNKDLPTCNPNPKHDFGKCKKGTDPPDNALENVLDNCSCQESGQDCIERLLQWWNATHFIDNVDCEYLDKVEGSPTYAQAINTDSESLNKKWSELYLEYQLLKESFSDYPNNMTTIERMAEIDDETMRIATILSEREFTIVIPEMDVRNVTFDGPIEPDCGPNTFLNEMGVCQVIDGGCEPDINGNTTWCGPQYDYWKIIFSEPSAFLFVFGTLGLIVGIPIVLIYYFRRKQKRK